MRRRERLLSNGPSSGKRPSRGIHFEERKAPCELAKKSRAKRPASRFNYWCDLELTSCPSVKPQFNHVLINNLGPKIKMEIILYPFIVIAFLTGKFIFFFKVKNFFSFEIKLANCQARCSLCLPNMKRRKWLPFLYVQNSE